MIDLHCHILPGIDDGASDIQESLGMAHLALGDGVDTVVATPHTLDGMYLNTRDQICRSVESLRNELSRQKMTLRICPGADVHLCPGLLQKIEDGEALTLNDTGRYMLLELPPQTIPAGVKDEVFALKLNGITPIITHPERHPVIQRDLHVLYELISAGALGQVTAMSITGDFGLPIMACTRAMLELRLIHVIASDGHSPKIRPPLLSRALDAAEEILGSAEEAEQMVTHTPAAILSGGPVAVATPGTLKKSRFFG